MFSRKTVKTVRDKTSTLTESQLEAIRKIEENKNLLDDGEPQQPTE